jgi:hypothetical protein
MAFAMSRWETEDVGELAMCVRVSRPRPQATPAQELAGFRDLGVQKAGKAGGPCGPRAPNVNPANPRVSATFGEESRNELKRFEAGLDSVNDLSSFRRFR